MVSEHFKAIARGTLELHLLIMAGKCDSPEADVIRDSMEPAFGQLSDRERALAEHLAVAVYKVLEEPCSDAHS